MWFFPCRHYENAANLTVVKSERTVIVCNIPIIGHLLLSGQRYIAIYLAAVVVLCPFQCVLLAKTSADVGEKVCCGNCGTASKTPNKAPQNSTPKNPSDCPCHGCFCCGALPVDKVEDCSDFVVSNTLDDIDIVKLDVLVADPPFYLGFASFELPSNLSGRAASVAFSCWLL